MFVRTPLGRISWISILIVLVIAAAIAAGLIVPGRTGEIIEIAAWLAVAVVVFFEIGLRTLPVGDHDGKDRWPR